uniref:Polysaccharide deacetylase n=1 Tax=Magnetococcus massalia (strain MO-1) TaxID=451514 RepID=A0A1S7LEH3_MAGMO|nr:conserved protein of unknown function [Candidatus Magnetococcus massalia]
MAIELYLSADYELFFAQNLLPPEQVLIDPTEQLLQACEAVDAPLTLFCDWASLVRYRQWGEDAFVDAVEAQLKQAIARGHDVQLHLHPHWLRTERKPDGSFVFAPKDYLLGSYEEDPEQRYQSMVELIGQGRDYFETLLQPIESSYRCRTFRGGGYGIQPHTEQLFKALQACGMVVDSTVAPGYRLTTDVHRVDFTSLVGRANAWYGVQQGLASPCEPGEGLFEVPIGAADLGEVSDWNPWPEALGRAWDTLRHGGPKYPPRGAPVGWQLEPPLPLMQRPKRAWWNLHAVRHRRYAKLEMQTSARLMRAVMQGHLSRERDYQGTHYLSINSHPKGMQRDHMGALKQFVRGLQREHGAAIRFRTFRALADQWGVSHHG